MMATTINSSTYNGQLASNSNAIVGVSGSEKTTGRGHTKKKNSNVRN
jgi:hypothetical protein